MTRDSERQMGMYGQAPSEIGAVRIRFGTGLSAPVVRDAEIYIRELVAGQATPEQRPDSLNTPEAEAFLTEGRPEFGGRSIFATLRHIVGEELKRGTFTPGAAVPPLELVQTISRKKEGRKSPDDTWVGRNHFYGIGVPRQVLNQILSEVPTQPRQKGSEILTTYDRQAVEERLQKYFAQTPRVNSRTGLFEDESGVWVTRAYLTARYGISHFLLNTYLTDVLTRPGLNKGKDATLYNLSQAKENLKGLIQTPSETGGRGSHVEKGVDWINAEEIARRLHLSPSTVKAALTDERFKTVRGKNGKDSKCYDFGRAKKLLEPLTSLPVANPTSNGRMVTGSFLAERYPLSIPTIANRLKTIGVRGRGIGGRHAILYPLHEAEKILAEK